MSEYRDVLNDNLQPGACGLCESIYTVIPNIPTVSSTSTETIVTKVRDYLNCVKKPLFEIGLMANTGYGLNFENTMEVSIWRPQNLHN